MADVGTIDDVLRAVSTEFDGQSIPVSAALGEVTDWNEGRTPPLLPRGLSFVKLGLAGTTGDADWCLRWAEVRSRFEWASSRPLPWIAVAFADWNAAGAPQPSDVVEAAGREKCVGVLFDTCIKKGRTLLDGIETSELTQLTERAHQLGLKVALAGSLRVEMLPGLKCIGADIIAVRSAACRHGSRTTDIDPAAVRALKSAIA